MFHKTATLLAVLAGLATAFPIVAQANDPAPNTKDRGSKAVSTGKKTAVKSSDSTPGINPRANPNNDQNGPRASEPRTDATPNNRPR